MPVTREQIEKAIKYYKRERDNAIAVLNSSFGNGPGENDIFRNRKERAQLAVDALEKLIPRKPICESLADRSCPACDAYIPFDALNDNIEDAPKYCKNCGQALDWSDCNA